MRRTVNKLIFSAYLAIMYGIGLISFETLVNWGQWQWWPFWLVDYVAATLLILGGIATLNNRTYGSRLLCASWGFALGMMWMSLSGNISEGTDPDRAGRVVGLYVTLIVTSIAISLIGLLLAMTKDDPQ